MFPEWHPETIKSFPVYQMQVVVSVVIWKSALRSLSLTTSPIEPVLAVRHSFIEQSSDIVIKDLSVSFKI